MSIINATFYNFLEAMAVSPFRPVQLGLCMRRWGAAAAAMADGEEMLRKHNGGDD